MGYTSINCYKLILFLIFQKQYRVTDVSRVCVGLKQISTCCWSISVHTSVRLISVRHNWEWLENSKCSDVGIVLEIVQDIDICRRFCNFYLIVNLYRFSAWCKVCSCLIYHQYRFNFNCYFGTTQTFLHKPEDTHHTMLLQNSLYICASFMLYYLHHVLLKMSKLGVLTWHTLLFFASIFLLDHSMQFRFVYIALLTNQHCQRAEPHINI